MNGPVDIAFPRVIIAGLRGDGGKSLVSLALAASLSESGRAVAPFKQGPDYIDTAWLGAAAGRPGRNLDTYMMGTDAVMQSLASQSDCDIAVIEGKRGLFDGVDEEGTHSTAALAKRIGAPIVLVVDVSKTTRTAAALVRGCQVMDRNICIAGAVLNRCRTLRQESIIRRAVETECGVPVLGVIPPLDETPIPMRHLGLACVGEMPDAVSRLLAVRDIGRRFLNVEQIAHIAKGASVMEGATNRPPVPKKNNGKKIGVLRGPAFSFYYVENLAALVDEGATLVDIDPMRDCEVPNDIDGLLAGGGFPELYAEELSRNLSFIESLRRSINRGLPVYAECGGLMYLCLAVERGGVSYPMTGILPFEVSHTERPVGHGYVQAVVENDNPFFEKGLSILGHEFHYSKASPEARNISCVLQLSRGRGLVDHKDGAVFHRVFAAYTHVHALGVPSWAPGFVKAL